MSITCEICNQGPQSGITVYRINAKGQPGIWRCTPHLDAPVDPVVKKLVEILEERDD